MPQNNYILTGAVLQILNNELETVEGSIAQVYSTVDHWTNQLKNSLDRAEKSQDTLWINQVQTTANHLLTAKTWLNELQAQRRLLNWLISTFSLNESKDATALNPSI
jgi:hypothetical protein